MYRPSCCLVLVLVLVLVGLYRWRIWVYILHGLMGDWVGWHMVWERWEREGGDVGNDNEWDGWSVQYQCYEVVLFLLSSQVAE